MGTPKSSYLYKYKIILFFLALVLFIPNKALAEEKIDNFFNNVTVEKDGSITVRENIYYDFGNNQKHGIIRKIPFIKTNEDGKRYKMEIYGISVFDEKNDRINYSINKSKEELELKIGDADTLVSGKKTYLITYKVKGAIAYYTDHDELYWNVTGDKNTISILKSGVSITLPDEAYTFGSVNVVCFTGSQGSKNKDCSTTTLGKEIQITSNIGLNPYEGLTIAVSFPKNIVSIMEPDEVGISNPVILFIRKVFIILLKITLYSGIFWWNVFYPIKVFLKWNKDKRNTNNLQRIVSAWFKSPETLDKRSLTPAETGALVDKNIDHKDITSTIIDLAQRGYLKIKVEGKKNTTIIKNKDYENDSNILEFEKNLMEGIFKKGVLNERHIDDLSTDRSFYTCIEEFKNNIAKRLVKEQLFKDDIKNVDNKFTILGTFAFMSVNIIGGIIFLIFGRKSAQRTPLGIEKYSEGVSLKNFLISQDTQLNFQSDNQMFFEKLLPYATAFGVEKIWAKRFESLNMIKPDWYEGDIVNAGVMTSLSSRMTSKISSNVSMMSSSRSSSGFSSGFSSGGHSGGGGGGGSTGSW